LVRYASKVAPVPQVLIQTTRWYPTREELPRYPASHHGVVYRCGERTVLFVIAWTGCGGTIARPPLSPDLTALHFSVWGYVKEEVFFSPTFPASLEELRARITEAVATTDTESIHRMWGKIVYRWDICHVPRDTRKPH